MTLADILTKAQATATLAQQVSDRVNAIAAGAADPAQLQQVSDTLDGVNNTLQNALNAHPAPTA